MKIGFLHKNSPAIPKTRIKWKAIFEPSQKGENECKELRKTFPLRKLTEIKWGPML